MKLNSFLLTGTIALGACGTVDKAADFGLSYMNVEAGRHINEGGFGNPTLNNQLAQSAYLDQDGLILDLATKFEKDVPTMINFEFNSARLDAEAKEILSQQAKWIKMFPEIKFRVYGHTDLVGSPAYNKALGLRRARAAVRYLVSQGVNADNLEAMSSFGETQPLIVTENPERRNRRTVTEVSGFARNFVGTGLDGKYAAALYQRYHSHQIALGGAAAANTN